MLVAENKGTLPILLCVGGGIGTHTMAHHHTEVWLTTTQPFLRCTCIRRQFCTEWDIMTDLSSPCLGLVRISWRTYLSLLTET